MRSLKEADKETRKQVRATLREVGDIVKTDAASKFDRYDSGSAAGFKVRVRQRGVAVEQSRRKTTGKRGDYGSLQMRRALLPSLEENTSEIKEAFEDAVEEIARIIKGA